MLHREMVVIGFGSFSDLDKIDQSQHLLRLHSLQSIQFTDHLSLFFLLWTLGLKKGLGIRRREILLSTFHSGSQDGGPSSSSILLFAMVKEIPKPGLFVFSNTYSVSQPDLVTLRSQFWRSLLDQQRVDWCWGVECPILLEFLSGVASNTKTSSLLRQNIPAEMEAADEYFGA